MYKSLAVIALSLFLSSCAAYHIHVSVLPENRYDVFSIQERSKSNSDLPAVAQNDTLAKGQTDPKGQIELVVTRVNLSQDLTVIVKNDHCSGYVTFQPIDMKVIGRSAGNLNIINSNSDYKISNSFYRQDCNINFAFPDSTELNKSVQVFDKHFNARTFFGITTILGGLWLVYARSLV
jgi:hypothetical protein